jgi:hypothetical protein
MRDVKIDAVFWLLGLVIFVVAAIIPEALVRWLGRGRVRPTSGVLMFLRISAWTCVCGTIYRLLNLCLHR